MERVIVIIDDGKVAIYGDVIALVAKRTAPRKEFESHGWRVANLFGQLAPAEPKVFEIAFGKTDYARRDPGRPTLKIFSHEMKTENGPEMILLFRACDPDCRENYLVKR